MGLYRGLLGGIYDLSLHPAKIVYNESKEFFRLDVMRMDLAKVSANGQITVPVEIRRYLEIREGDKILFTRTDSGEVIIGNASRLALLNAQKAFIGVAGELGNPSEDDIQSWIDGERYGKEFDRRIN